MKKWLRRIRGALGMGLTWAVGWTGFLTATTLVLDVIFGWPWTPTLTNLLANSVLFAGMGFVAGTGFSAALGIAEQNRRFDEMSMRRFAGWGALAGLLVLMTIWFISPWSVTLSEFLVSWIPAGLLGAGSSAGSLALARRAQDRDLLEPGEDAGLIEGE